MSPVPSQPTASALARASRAEARGRKAARSAGQVVLASATRGRGVPSLLTLPPELWSKILYVLCEADPVAALRLLATCHLLRAELFAPAVLKCVPCTPSHITSCGQVPRVCASRRAPCACCLTAHLVPGTAGTYKERCVCVAPSTGWGHIPCLWAVLAGAWCLWSQRWRVARTKRIRLFVLQRSFPPDRAALACSRGNWVPHELLLRVHSTDFPRRCFVCAGTCPRSLSYAS